MMKRVLFLALSMAAIVLAACSDNNNSEVPQVDLPDNVLVLTNQQVSNYDLLQSIEDENSPPVRLGGSIAGRPVTIVKLSGKASHVGVDISQSPPEYIDYHATVPHTRVWIAEHPETRDLNLRTDETGWWTIYVVKDTAVDLELSFVYEKEDWATTKTNVHTISDQDDTDFGIQLIDGDYYQYSMLPFIEAMMRSNGYPNFFFETALVVTVGKSWASLHDDRLPHGDPGAIATLRPESAGLIGPVYFNKSVIPDLAQPDVSVDGGVAWLNPPPSGLHYVTAMKEGVNYPTIKFDITEADKQHGVQLYIASPPDSLEGDNDSPRGEY